MISEKLVMRFGGENGIDLETLSVSLNATVDTLKNLADNLISENDFCKFKVLNIQKGSFVIDIEQIIEYAPTIMPLMPTVIKTFKELLEIRKFLNGEPPKEIVKNDGVAKIENKNGDIYCANTITVNMYNNNLEKGMAATSRAVLDDKERTSLSYEFIDDDGKSELLKLDRENLSYLSIPQDVDRFNKEIEENEVTTWVKVNKPDLNGKSQWGLTLNGKKMFCVMSDQEFLDKVHDDKISFTSNTKLYVKMVVRYKVSKSEGGESSEIISRNIIKVFDIQNN